MNQNQLRNILGQSIGRFNISKMLIYIYILEKTEILFKVYVETQKTQDAQIILKKQSKQEDLHTATIMKTFGYLCKGKYIGRQYINKPIHTQPIFIQQWYPGEEKTAFFFFNKCVWNNIGINLKKKVKLRFCLLTYTEINLKQIIELTKM